MTFALDSSVALKWVLPEAHSDKAIRLRDDFHNGIRVALAEREACELVTADDKLVNNLQAKFPFIRHLATFP
jgi:predicted nucleic acid-binding protein